MNFNRQYTILAGVPGHIGFELSSVGKARPLHINFDFEKSDNPTSNTGKLQISNLNNEHKAILSEEGCIVEIRAGYSDTLGSIFLGGVMNPSETLQNADRTLELELFDGQSYNDTVGSISMNGVVTGTSLLSELQSKMGIESAILTEKASSMLQTAKYSNGYCYVGKLKTALQSLTSKADLNYSIQNGVLQIFAAGEAVTTQAYVISVDTGLISIPKKITVSQSATSKSGSMKGGVSLTTETKNGIPGYEIEYLINGAIGINDLVKIESKEVNGIFRVCKQHYMGDNYSGDWKCTAQVVEVSV